jgi:hypothetical protein
MPSPTVPTRRQARFADVGLAREQFDAAAADAALPGDALFVEVEVGVFGYVKNVRIPFIDGVAFGFEVDPVAINRDQFGKGMAERFDV